MEIVGAIIQMLLKGVNGELRNAADQSEIMQVMNGKAAKEDVGVFLNPRNCRDVHF
jgi:Mn-containing catalase